MIGWAAVEAPWGPVRLAADEDAVVAVDVLSSPETFGLACRQRLGELPVTKLLTPSMVRALTPVDSRTYQAGMLGVNLNGVYKP